MPVALDRAAMQFQSPNNSVDVALSGDTYTLRRDIGSSRYWAVDLTGATIGGRYVRSLASHRIEGAESVTLGHPALYISAWEYALTVDGSFVGTRAHGYELDTYVSVAVDGATITPTGTPTTGRTVTIVRRSTIYSPSSSQAVGNAQVTYQMTRQGLAVEWQITWIESAASGQCYGAMMPCATVLDTGKTTSGSKATLTADNGSVNSSSQSNTAWLWDASGNYGAMMALRDLATVRSWGASDGKDMWIEDRADGSLNKIYSGFIGPAITASDVWSGSVLYAADYFSSSAATVLDF